MINALPNRIMLVFALGLLALNCGSQPASAQAVGSRLGDAASRIPSLVSALEMVSQELEADCTVNSGEPCVRSSLAIGNGSILHYHREGVSDLTGEIVVNDDSLDLKLLDPNPNIKFQMIYLATADRKDTIETRTSGQQTVRTHIYTFTVYEPDSRHRALVALTYAIELAQGKVFAQALRDFQVAKAQGDAVAMEAQEHPKPTLPQTLIWLRGFLNQNGCVFNLPSAEVGSTHREAELQCTKFVDTTQSCYMAVANPWGGILPPQPTMQSIHVELFVLDSTSLKQIEAGPTLLPNEPNVFWSADPPKPGRLIFVNNQSGKVAAAFYINTKEHADLFMNTFTRAIQMCQGGRVDAH
jgi:hypothetical protein